MIMMHSDDKGLVLPPKVANTQVVIIPILFDDSKEKVLKVAEDMKKKLEVKGISVNLDDREGYSPGWKFNEWELKGIPVRIEIGPRDLKNKEVMMARRDTGAKKTHKISEVDKVVPKLLNDIQSSLLKKAEKLLKERLIKVKTCKEAEKEFKKGNFVLTQWCGGVKCEEDIKEKTGGKSLNSPLKQDKVSGTCFNCKQKAEFWFRFGRSY
jgi:prolyl-tRNA synthetase